jgi:hypothetical protein
MTVIHTRKVHAVKQVPYSNRYDVEMIGGPLNHPVIDQDVEVFAKYVGGGRSVCTIRVPMKSLQGVADPFPSLTRPQMDGIARRIDGRYRKTSEQIGTDSIGKPVCMRTYAFNAND